MRQVSASLSVAVVLSVHRPRPLFPSEKDARCTRSYFSVSCPCTPTAPSDSVLSPTQAAELELRSLVACGQGINLAPPTPSTHIAWLRLSFSLSAAGHDTLALAAQWRMVRARHAAARAALREQDRVRGPPQGSAPGAWGKGSRTGVGGGGGSGCVGVWA